MNLASVHSEAELTELLSVIDTNNLHWIGLNDNDTEGTFIWSDGTASDFFKWNGG